MNAAAAPRPAAAVRANAITVDVEDWFHICGVGGALAPARWDALPSRVERTTRLLLDDFDRLGIRATFLVLGWVAARYPALVDDIRRAGHEIGSHGFSHTRVFELSADAFRHDLARSTAAIAAAGGGTPRAFRAPEWSLTASARPAIDALAAEGFRVDASMAPLRLVGDVGAPRVPHVIEAAGGRLLELPPLVADRFGQVMPMGWGWGLRMSTPRRVLRTIAQTNQAGAPSILTVHPWEIDPDPPRVPLPLRLRFAHYFRLDGFRQRLMEVLRHADAGALEDLAVVRNFA